MKVLSRMHTGEHIFVGALIKDNPDIAMEKVKLDEHESVAYIFCKDLDWDKVLEAEKLTNKIIRENRKVIIKEIPKQEAADLPGLRIRIERIKEDNVRVVEIEGYDVSACTGQHCTETGQVKHFLVTSFNSLGKGRFEIRFMVDVIEKLYDLSTPARKITAIIGADYSTLEKSIENLKQENERMKEQLRELQKQSFEQVPDGDVVYKSVDNFEKKILISAAKEWSKQKKLVCFMNKLDGSLQVLIATSEKSEKNAEEILKGLIEKFNGKGGGKDHFAMGGFEEKHEQKISEAINIYTSS